MSVQLPNGGNDGMKSFWSIISGWCACMLVLGFLMASSCAQQDEPVGPRHEARVEQTYYLPFSNQVVEFKLDDGTRCVTGYRMGMACEWKR